jgi:hypothetical protein
VRQVEGHRVIEVHENLFVGAEIDEHAVRGKEGWFIIHACKEPYHRQALGYSGRAASKDHPEYLMARRDGRLILNLVDVDNASFISPVIIDAALEAIAINIPNKKVLVHCNQGQSRSPTIAFLYLLRHTTKFKGLMPNEALSSFRAIYPHFMPARGMADFVHFNWQRYTPPA